MAGTPSSVELRRTRLLHVIIAASYPLGGYLMQAYSREITDAFWLRYLLGGLQLFAVGLSYFRAEVRDRLERILFISFFVGTAHAMAFLAANHLAPAVAVYCLIHFTAVSAYLPTRKALIGYFVFTVATSALAAVINRELVQAPIVVLVFAGLTAFSYFLQSGRFRAIEELADSESRFRALFEATLDPLAIHEGGIIREVNPAFLRLFGYERAAAIGMPIDKLIAPGSREAFAAALADDADEPVETVGLKETGGTFYLEVVTRRHRFEGRAVRVSSLRDVTERRRAEEKIADAAHRDPLTDLPTLRVFQDRLTVALATAKRRKEGFGVAQLDLDGLAQINAEHGRDVGDMVLLGTAARLKKAIRDSDTVARTEDDDFIFILSGADDLGARIAAEKLIDAFNEPFVIQGKQIAVTVSLGLALYPSDADHPKRLVEKSSAALLSAKGRERHASVFALFSEVHKSSGQNG